MLVLLGVTLSLILFFVTASCFFGTYLSRLLICLSEQTAQFLVVLEDTC